MSARQVAAELPPQPAAVFYMWNTNGELQLTPPPPSNAATCMCDSQVAQLPLNLSRGSWQHICVSWSQKGGAWQAYQGGKLKGEGHALAAGHSIRPRGVFVLGQEQVGRKNGEQRVRSVENLLLTAAVAASQ